jgi:hypothetical protein
MMHIGSIYRYLMPRGEVIWTASRKVDVNSLKEMLDCRCDKFDFIVRLSSGSTPKQWLRAIYF